MYVFLRHKYLPDKASARDNKSHFLSLVNSKSQQTVLNVAKFFVCAFNLRTSKMEVPAWLEDKLINLGVFCMKPTRYVSYTLNNISGRKIDTRV